MSDQPDRVLTQIGPKMFLITIYAIMENPFSAHTQRSMLYSTV